MTLSIWSTVLFMGIEGATTFNLERDTIPETVAKLTAQLDSKRESEIRDATKKLAADPVFSWYVQQNIPSLKAHQTRTHRKVVSTAQRVAHARLAGQAKVWGRQFRPDMLVEYGTFDANEDEKPGQIEPYLDLLRSIDEVVHEYGNLTRYRASHYLPRNDRVASLLLKGQLQLDCGTNLTFDKNVDRRRFVLSNTTTLKIRYHSMWFVSAKGGIIDPNRYSDWSFSALVSNATLKDAPFAEMIRNLIIVDGDFQTDSDRPQFSDCIVIANGSIDIKNKPQLIGSYFWGNGGIRMPVPNLSKECVFASGGKIVGPDKKSSTLLPDEKAELLGFKFFQLSDLGLAVKTTPLGVAIQRIDFGSPFRRFGLRVGDIVTKVDDTKIETPDQLRRATRAAYVREVGCFHITRGTETNNRLVAFANVLLP